MLGESLRVQLRDLDSAIRSLDRVPSRLYARVLLLLVTVSGRHSVAQTQLIEGEIVFIGTLPRAFPRVCDVVRAIRHCSITSDSGDRLVELVEGLGAAMLISDGVVCRD